MLPLIVLNGWVLIQLFQYFEPLATIFIVAAVMAFILNYPVEFLQRHDINRNRAVLIVLLVSLVGLATLGITLLPALLEQLSEIVEQLPNWLNGASQKLQAVQSWAASHRLPINLSRIIQEFTDRLPSQIEGLGDETLLLTLGAVGGLSSLLLTLVLMLYLLLDGKRVWDTLFLWLPLRHRQQVRRSLEDDFHNYFIGQATLGLIIGTLLSIVFFVLGVPYSLLLGSTVGIMSLIPFGDTLGYGLVCLLLAAESPGLALTVLIISIIIDQVLDQAVAPRILGEFTGLKPIWVIIALLLGTKLFGFAGLLTAVPIASFINSLVENESPLLEENGMTNSAPAPDASERTEDYVKS
ncbi:MAG: AI-2E family transporter [Elainellaceae cyanobacterium]